MIFISNIIYIKYTFNLVKLAYRRQGELQAILSPDFLFVFHTISLTKFKLKYLLN